MAGRPTIAVSASGAHRKLEFEDAEDLLALLTVWGIVEGTYGKQGYRYGLASAEALALLERKGPKPSDGSTPDDDENGCATTQYPELRCVMNDP